MNKYSTRFNKSRGQPGRGSLEHVWRVFENDTKEYIFKHVIIDVPSRSEKSVNSDDWNITCNGILIIDKATSTATISAENISVVDSGNK